MTTYTEKNGRFTFDISYRRFQGDEGLSIRVLGPVANEAKELMRFDCFEKRPHYHTEVYGKNKITTIKDTDAAEWALATLKNQFETLVQGAGADSLQEAEYAGLNEVLRQVANKSRALIAAEKQS